MEGGQIERDFWPQSKVARFIEEGVWWDRDEEERAWEDDLWPWLECLYQKELWLIWMRE
jgi:hypothetical protein